MVEARKETILEKALRISRGNERLSTFANPSLLSKVGYWISTGCQPLDMIMGGGVPGGRMMEIYGDTSSGKSLIAGHILAETQAAGGTAVLFDSETATSEEIMLAVGIDPDALIYSIPDTIEDLYSDMIALIEAKRSLDPDGFMVIVWDSVAATSSEGELKKLKEEGLGGSTIGTHARQISKLCRVMKADIARDNISLVFINQTREKIGVLFGSNVATFGGKAIGFYSSIRVELKHVSKIKDKKTGAVTGIKARAGVVKNKLAPPFGQCDFLVEFGVGIDEPATILEWMRKHKLTTGAGWKRLELLDGTELKFQHSSWADTFYDNEDVVRELLNETY